MTRTEMPVEHWWRAAPLLLICSLVMSIFWAASANEDRSIALERGLQTRPFTTITINGAPTSALLDTGATIALIDSAYLPAEDLDAAPIERARILGVGGERFYPITHLPELSMGPESWINLRVAVNTEQRFPVHKTILPISIFDSRVVDFDFNNHRVHLYDGRPKRAGRGRNTSVKYENVNDLIFVPIWINGARGKALIDTGADVSFVNPEFADRGRGRLDEVRTKLIRGSDLSNNRASVFSFRRLRFADHEVRRFEIPVLDTELFAELGFADEPMMVMGMDVLRQFRIQVDRKRERIYFVPARTNSRVAGGEAAATRAERLGAR